MRRVAVLAMALAALTAGASAGEFQGDGTGGVARACSEPWSKCSSDAQWLRRVLARVGYRNIGDTGSALTTPIVVGHVRQLRYDWATSAWLPKPPYRRLYKVGDTTVYGDHDVRIVWSVQGVGVWVEPPPSRRTVARLVVATRAVRRSR